MTAHHTQRTARLGTAALALVLSTLLPGAARAQSSEQAGEIQSYRLPGWSFTPSLAFGALYDSNVALADPRADQQGTLGDSLFDIVPGGQLEFIGRRTDFAAGYRGFVRRYMDLEGLDGFDQRAAMSMKRTMTRRFTLFARDSYSDSPTTDEVEVNGVPFRRTGSRTNTFAASSEYRLTKFATWSLRYDNTWVSFDRPDIYLTGGWIHALRNELSYQLGERVSVGGEYGYRRASLNEGLREFGFQDAGGVVHFTPAAHVKVSAAAGVATLRDRNLGDSRSGPYLRLGVSRTVDIATLGVNFERQYVPSFGFGGASNSQELRGYVNMPLRNRRVYTQGSAAWRRTMPFENEALQLDTIWMRSTIGYVAARWARVEALYTFTRQDSIVSGGEVGRHRVGVQFVISQPMRIE